MQFQYQVPQFIDIEDRVVGPLTLKQFFILAAGFGITGLLFMVLRLSFAIALGIPLVTFTLILAFARIQGMPFWRYLAALLGYITKPQEYFWRK